MSRRACKIVLASRNPVKAAAVRGGFRKVFPDLEIELEDVAVPSGVADQPASDGETLHGARTRAGNAARAVPGADFWIGVEGGIEDDGEAMYAFAWVVVRSGNLAGSSRTATFQLPEAVARLVRAGHELGEADDLVFDRSNSKQRDGAVGILTRNLIDRAALYEHAMILALVPFKNRELYRSPTGGSEPSATPAARHDPANRA